MGVYFNFVNVPHFGFMFYSQCKYKESLSNFVHVLYLTIFYSTIWCQWAGLWKLTWNVSCISDGSLELYLDFYFAYTYKESLSGLLRMPGTSTTVGNMGPTCPTVVDASAYSTNLDTDFLIKFKRQELSNHNRSMSDVAGIFCLGYMWKEMPQEIFVVDFLDLASPWGSGLE
jgi:hypothetical protein